MLSIPFGWSSVLAAGSCGRERQAWQRPLPLISSVPDAGPGVVGRPARRRLGRCSARRCHDDGGQHGYRTAYGHAGLDLTVDQSGLLHQRLESDKLDVFIGKRPSGEQRGQLVRRDRLVWVGTPSTRLDLTRPLPLVVYPAPSISRTEIRRALHRARMPFRTACVCRGVNGLIAAVAASVGISALAASLVPAQLTTLGPGHRLPELGTIDPVLLTNPRTAQRPAVRALIATVLASGSRTLAAYRDQHTAATSG